MKVPGKTGTRVYRRAERLLKEADAIRVLRSRLERATIEREEIVRAQTGVADPRWLVDAVVERLPAGTRLDEVLLDGHSCTLTGSADEPGAIEAFRQSVESIDTRISNVTCTTDRAVSPTVVDALNSVASPIVQAFEIRADIDIEKGSVPR